MNGMPKFREIERTICKGFETSMMTIPLVEIFQKNIPPVSRNSKIKLRVTKPPIGPSLGMIMHGPDFRNLDIPKIAENIDVRNAIAPTVFR